MELSWIVTSLLGAIVLYCMYRLATMNKNYWQSRGVVCLDSTPIFGILVDILLMRKGISQLFVDLYKKLDGQRFGGYFQFMTPVLMIRDPELINQVLIKDFSHFEDRGPEWKNSSDLFSLGISNLTGEEWRTARHKLTPTFTSGKLKTMFGAITECSDGVILHVKNKLGQSIDARELGFKYIINVIAGVAFGLKLDTFEDKDNEFFKVSSNFFKPSAWFLIKMMIAMSFPKVKNFFNLKLTEDNAENFFRKLTKDIIQYRESTGKKRNDFLQLMLEEKRKEKESIQNGLNTTTNISEAEDPDDKELLENLKYTSVGNEAWSKTDEIFTDDFIAAQTFIFISGGSETTSAVLGFVLYELAANKDLQEQLQHDTDNIVSANGFTYEAVKKMTYMEQFIYESIRLHPVAGALIRLCTRDYQIPGTDIIIEKGTAINIPFVGLHKDPQYFSEPEKYDPDRFEDMESVPKSVFTSFGSGPRICIAMRLAMLQMKVFLAKLLLNYNIILSEKTKLPLKPLRNAFIINVEGGIWVKFENRQK